MVSITLEQTGGQHSEEISEIWEMGADRLGFFYWSSTSYYRSMDGLFDMLFIGMAIIKILSLCFIRFWNCLDYRERDCAFRTKSIDSFLIYRVMVLATLVRTMVYLENTNIGEKRINKKRKRHTPLNPPSMGEWIQQFPSLEGCRFTVGRVPFEFSLISWENHLEKRIKRWDPHVVR